MPSFIPFTRKNLDSTLEAIRASVYCVVGGLSVTAWRTPEPVPFSERRRGHMLTLKVGDEWGKLFDCAWFRFEGTVPPEAMEGLRRAPAGMPGRPPMAPEGRLVLLIDLSGEVCIVDSAGSPIRGLTTGASASGYPLGTTGKTVFPLPGNLAAGDRIDVWGDAGCNDLFGALSGGGIVKEASIAVCREDVRALFYDFEVLLDLLKGLPDDSPRSRRIADALTRAAWALAPRIGPENSTAARGILAPLLAERGGDPALRVSAVGHAHIDLAWLWPIRETVRKGARTFATALANMELYPDYVFGASQPQLFEWMKDNHPALYARIRARVKEGRLEAQGAMWVEADTNLTGGESLVRQLLFGKKFFRKEFGVDPRFLWLPDCFGYSAALPQILKKAGVDCFVTQKLSWSLVNPFPHHSFIWRGIDGTSVLAHMLPEETYNGAALPRSVKKMEKGYADAGVSEGALMVFGIGDGGGGPGEEHLERLARIRDLSGLSPVTQEPAAAFLERWAGDAGRFPSWVGELYLERHQGTFTTEARNKRANRLMERGLRDLEWLASMDRVLGGAEYPSDRLEIIWKETLLYQFHDVLPGSAIKRVYDESLARYNVLERDVKALRSAHLSSLARRISTRGMEDPVFVFNSLSWAREEWIRVRRRWMRVNVPAMGWAAVEAPAKDPEVPGLSAGVTGLENDMLRVEIGPDGSLSSVFDKVSSREALRGPANRLAVYRDDGDAWDFPMDYALQEPRRFALQSSSARVEGPCAVVEQTYTLGSSTLFQQIVLVAGSRRLEFRTRVDWRETASMLRTSFPVDVHAEEASCEIQFGHVRRPTHRNTTWDLAKDEVPAHRWADLSQRDHGAALLNDCKYGYKIKDGALDLNLLRSPPYPGPRLVKDEEIGPGGLHHAYTDQGEHEFTYALFPHAGDAVSGGVARAGYELNVPLIVADPAETGGTGADAVAAAPTDGRASPPRWSFLGIDPSDVVVETVKKAEDGEDLIVRLYESSGASVRAVLRFGFALEAAWEVDLLEENPHPLALTEGTIVLSMRPFQIATVRVKRA